MNLSATYITRLILGLVLIVLGSGLFVVFTGSINAAVPNGAPIGVVFLSDAEWCFIVFVLDLVFLSVVFAGVRFAGLGWRVFGLIVLIAAAAALSLGIWNHVTGPPLDYHRSDRHDERFPVPFGLNIVAYAWSGLCMLGGLLLSMRGNAKWSTGKASG